MLVTRHNISLRPYNTFGMDVSAAAYTILQDEQDVAHIHLHPEYSRGIFVLGGGSNLLLTQDLQPWVIHNQIQGIEIIKEDSAQVWLRVGAGVVWHSFVLHAVANGWGGVENLSLIPGTVGAAPIQNIGAYGAEVKDTIDYVRFWHIEDQQFYEWSNEACAFGYRDSVFKQSLKGKIIITAVIFKLSKNPTINISYGTVKEQLVQMGRVDAVGIRDVSEAIIAIRQSKLPDPNEIGNSGSFFKNPEIPEGQYFELQRQYSNIPGYHLDNKQVKVPAAWLIEQCGWKGWRSDNYGVHARQALVLVNYGGASGLKLLQLSSDIIASVKDKFNIILEREVQVI
jgi:UDP-N-acetylmuramate dehydrogenase